MCRKQKYIIIVDYKLVIAMSFWTNIVLLTLNTKTAIMQQNNIEPLLDN